MFWKKRKAKKKRDEQYNRLNMLIDLEESLQTMLRTKREWQNVSPAWVNSHLLVHTWNVDLDRLVMLFPGFKEELEEAKGCSVWHLDYDTEIPYIQLSAIKSGNVQCYEEGHSIKVCELLENRKEVEIKYRNNYDEWNTWTETNVRTANIHWPWITYMVYQHQVVVPQMENKINKIKRKLEMQIFQLKRNLGYPGY